MLHFALLSFFLLVFQEKNCKLKPSLAVTGDLWGRVSRARGWGEYGQFVCFHVSYGRKKYICSKTAGKLQTARSKSKPKEREIHHVRLRLLSWALLLNQGLGRVRIAFLKPWRECLSDVATSLSADGPSLLETASDTIHTKWHFGHHSQSQAWSFHFWGGQGFQMTTTRSSQEIDQTGKLVIKWVGGGGEGEVRLHLKPSKMN